MTLTGALMTSVHMIAGAETGSANTNGNSPASTSAGSEKGGRGRGRGRQAAAKDALPADASAADFEKLRGWGTLSTIDKHAVRREHQALATGLERLGKAWIEVGEHLRALRDVLEPHGMFDAYLRLTPFGLSRATAYRRIRVAEKARRYLKPDLFRFALLSGLDKVNVEAVKVIPPPKNASPKEMRDYLKVVSTTPKAALDPEVLKKECVNFIRTRYEKLPQEWTSRKRAEWMRSVCGMAMGVIGASGEQKIEVEAVPSEWGKKLRNAG